MCHPLSSVRPKVTTYYEADELRMGQPNNPYYTGMVGKHEGDKFLPVRTLQWEEQTESLIKES